MEQKYPKIDAALKALDLVYEAEFVPLSQSHNKDWNKDKKRKDGEPVFKSPTLEWKIRIGRNSKNHHPNPVWHIQTDYGQGIAHAPGYEHSFRNDNWKSHYFQIVAEIGKTLVVLPPLGDTGKTDWFEAHERLKGKRGTLKKIPEPEFCDVMYSLLMDCDVLDRGSFEEWASDLGYDEDSRSAETIYRSCLDLALKMRNLIGDSKITELRDLYQEEGF